MNTFVYLIIYYELIYNRKTWFETSHCERVKEIKSLNTHYKSSYSISACPGGYDTPCNGHGQCSNSTGICECQVRFIFFLNNLYYKHVVLDTLWNIKQFLSLKVQMRQGN